MFAIVYRRGSDLKAVMELVYGKTEDEALEAFMSWDENKRYPPLLYGVCEVYGRITN